MKILVTGGGGFLGQALCRGLVDRGHTVRSFSRHHYPQLDKLGVHQITADLADQNAVNSATQGCQIVLHSAAKSGIWGRYDSYYNTNVIGTKNIITACQKNGIGRLIYTSTPSVTHRATRPISGATAENTPYGQHLKSPYAHTKMLAERAVLSVNGPTLATIALRPRLIWGSGDPHLLPRLIQNARSGKLWLINGGHNLIDTTYIDNAAQAHFDALEHLNPQARCAGKAYFISNAEPKTARNMINALLATVGIAPIQSSLSHPVALAIAAAYEAAWRILPLQGEPPLTRFIVEQLSTTHWYDITPATRDFGYVPKISIAQGLTYLRHTLQDQPR